jgi:hypothetical protein
MWKKILLIISFLVAIYFAWKKLYKGFMNNNSDFIIFREWIKYTNAVEFIAKCISISNTLGIKVNWLIAVMWKESKINHKAVNPTSNATGLIQFMPNTAKGLGTSVAELFKMDVLKQLDFVLKYFQPYKGKMKSFEDVYLAVFFPLAIGKDDDWIFKTSTLSAELIGRQNRVINGGKPINKIAFRKYLLKDIDTSLHKYLN